VRLKKPHPQQQQGLGPRVKSAFLSTAFLFQHGLMASQSIGLRYMTGCRRWQKICSGIIEGATETPLVAIG
jgi:hypothetical protein